MALLVGATAVACSDPAERDDAQPAGDGRLVMVSGRDDHGLLAEPTVAVYDGPRSGHLVGQVDDGTLVRVTAADRTWQHVVSVEGPSVDGWVDDFYLRGELRLVGSPPTCRARLGGRTVAGGTLVTVWRIDGGRVLVEEVADDHRRGWAARADLQELPPQGRRCGDDPPGSPEHHHGP